MKIAYCFKTEKELNDLLEFIKLRQGKKTMEENENIFGGITDEDLNDDLRPWAANSNNIKPFRDRLTHREPDPVDPFGEIRKMAEPPPGVKYDGGKIDPALIPAEVLRELAKVLTHGARKYAPDNWKFVENRRHRYTSALLRHLYEFQISPDSVDPETNLSHIAHVVANAVFLCYGVLEETGGTEKDEQP